MSYPHSTPFPTGPQVQPIKAGMERSVMRASAARRLRVAIDFVRWLVALVGVPPTPSFRCAPFRLLWPKTAFHRNAVNMNF